MIVLNIILGTLTIFAFILALGKFRYENGYSKHSPNKKIKK